EQGAIVAPLKAKETEGELAGVCKESPIRGHVELELRFSGLEGLKCLFLNLCDGALQCGTLIEVHVVVHASFELCHNPFDDFFRVTGAKAQTASVLAFRKVF